jgi:hypothetical protein
MPGVGSVSWLVAAALLPFPKTSSVEPGYRSARRKEQCGDPAVGQLLVVPSISATLDLAG